MTPRAEEIKPILDCYRNPYWFFLFHTFLSSFPSQRFCEGHDYFCPIKLTDHSNPSQDLQLENASSSNKGCFSHFECSLSVGRTTKERSVITMEVSNSPRTGGGEKVRFPRCSLTPFSSQSKQNWSGLWFLLLFSQFYILMFSLICRFT